MLTTHFRVITSQSAAVRRSRSLQKLWIRNWFPSLVAPQTYSHHYRRAEEWQVGRGSEWFPTIIRPQRADEKKNQAKAPDRRGISKWAEFLFLVTQMWRHFAVPVAASFASVCYIQEQRSPFVQRQNCVCVRLQIKMVPVAKDSGDKRRRGVRGCCTTASQVKFSRIYLNY